MYVPDRVIPNSYFDELLGENVSTWLENFVEIYERRWCSENESTADLAARAAQIAMKNGNVSADEIDLLIISTDTPEFISPSTSSKVHFMLGLKNAGTFDINTACAGFVTALETATKYIQSDKKYNTVLVIGAYAMSKYINQLDKKTANLFADGAGAFILKAEENTQRGYLASKMLTFSQFYEYMGIYAGGTFEPITEKVLKEKTNLLQIRNKFPNGINSQTWSAMARDMAAEIGIQPEDVSQYFLTQINIHSIRETMDMLGLPQSKAQTSMHKFGYTGSACIPIAFEEAKLAKKIKPGDIVFLIGSGGGLAFSGIAFRL
jgi:3-oxoacyl-[acyl-carrier-protein] synthase-3